MKSHLKIRSSKITSKIKIIILQVNHKCTLEVYWLNLKYFSGLTIIALSFYKVKKVLNTG